MVLVDLVDRLPDDTIDALIGNDLDPPMIDEVPLLLVSCQGLRQRR